MRKKKKVWIALVLMALFMGADVSGTIAYYWAVREGVRSDRLAAHKTAVILFSNFDANGKLDEETLRRIHHAVESLRQRDSLLIICCGGARPQTGQYGSLLMQDYLLEQGFEPSSIVAETNSNSTRSNIRSAAAVLESRRIAEATLISSPIHLPRVRHIASMATGTITFHYSAYPLDHGKPPANPATIYLQIHHEWAAWLVDVLLPDDVYNELLNRLRS